MERCLVRRHRWALPMLCALLALLAAACREGGIADLKDVAISSRDVPADWIPADFREAEGRGLWDTLPELLTANSDARLLLRAFETESGLHGAATILIQTEEPAALPQSTQSDGALTPLTRLLARQDALLGPRVRGGDPGTYFAASDLPVPGSLRSRLVRLLDDGYLYSDSLIFSVDPVLAVVTVWYPEQDGPFREVEEIAGDVEQRLRSYLNDN